MIIAVETEDLVIKRGVHIAVNGVSLTASAATWFGIVGANGSGKTSLLRGIAGRLPIEAGVCRIGGVDFSSDREARAKVCGFNPPTDSLPNNMTLSDLLKLVAGDAGSAREAIGVVWDSLDLDPVKGKWIGELSSGMRQRVSIALAFARDTSVVLLDEPFNWLDPVAAFDLKRALRAKVDQGLSLVTALHDLTTLCAFCGHGAMMDGSGSMIEVTGQELQSGKIDTIAFESQMIAKLKGKPAA